MDWGTPPHKALDAMKHSCPLHEATTTKNLENNHPVRGAAVEPSESNHRHEAYQQCPMYRLLPASDRRGKPQPPLRIPADGPLMNHFETPELVRQL